MTNVLKKLAYVEDEEDIRTIAKMALEMVGGYEVHLFASGDEALLGLPSLKPQLILMDVMMPGRDGPGTLQALREIPALAEVPVIFMTAKAQQAEIAQYIALGAIGVITKPFDPMALTGQITELWLQHQTR